ncbi:hypothetical protein [Thermococcus sp.]
MKRFLFILTLALSFMVISAACIGSQETHTSPSSSSSMVTSSTMQTTTTSSTFSTPLAHQKWNMSIVWHVKTFDIPLMDLSPDGSLAAAIDYQGHRLYLVRPDGSSVSFDLMEPEDIVEPVVAGVAIVEGRAYVLGSYGDFTGVRVYDWSGKVGETHEGGAGSVPDDILRSPSGNHLCYLVTITATDQVLVCDETKLKLKNAYSLKWVSDSGLVLMDKGEREVVMKNGQKLLVLNTTNVLAYGDKLVTSYGDALKVLSLDGKVLASREKAGFSMTTLMRWTLIPTKNYIFRHEPLEDTHVFTWNLTEVKVLPGFPYFANKNFVITESDGVIHCYSLEDFHEVFSVKVPGDSLGYIKLSDDGKVMLVSGEYGSFWLYSAK